MDETLIKKAFEFADYMSVISNQKNLLKEQFHQSIVYYEFGGTFTLNKELLTFVQLLISTNQTKNVILIDDNSIPVNIPDLNLFFNKIFDQYNNSVSLYYKNYLDLVSKRRVEKIVNLNE